MAGDLPPLDGLLAASHLAVPDDIPAIVQEHAERMGARLAVLYLADLDQRRLVPLPPPKAPRLEALGIDATFAGRCFRSVALTKAEGDNGGAAIWVPVLDGTERLGVLHLAFDAEIAPEETVKAFAGLVAELVMTKGSYGDYFEIARRGTTLTIGSELLWQLLPPLTFGTEDLVISAAFTPTSRLGGDAFDYGVDQTSAQIAIFDALGHDLQAGLLATAAVAAFRNGRRSQLEIDQTAAHIGSAVSDNFDESKFVTGIVARLDIDTGCFSWTVAGHPAPLLLRQGRVVKHLDSGRGQPFGVGPASDIIEERLEPGDRILLYTDGVTEAKNRNGEFFELETLIDLVSRTSETDPPPETMRLLMHALEEHNAGHFRDDATVVLVEWRGQGADQLKV